jgi:hypothetical protein
LHDVDVLLNDRAVNSPGEIPNSELADGIRYQGPLVIETQMGPNEETPGPAFRQQTLLGFELFSVIYERHYVYVGERRKSNDRLPHENRSSVRRRLDRVRGNEENVKALRRIQRG